jgi:hypothetical protein
LVECHAAWVSWEWGSSLVDMYLCAPGRCFGMSLQSTEDLGANGLWFQTSRQEVFRKTNLQKMR